MQHVLRWQEVFIHVLIGGLVAPAMIIFYPLGSSAAPLYFIIALGPGLITGLINALLGARKLVALFGAVLCGLAFPISMAIYGLRTHRVEAANLIIDVYIIGALVAIVAGSLPALGSFLRARLSTK